MKRREKPQPSPTGVPADLAAGPCIELWAEPGSANPPFSARRNWKRARKEWAVENGLTLPQDYRHLPPELRDRAPFHRRAKKGHI